MKSPKIDKPRVLVLLATYNGQAWLCEQVDSILSQNGVDVHVLIGDDVSKDGTRILLEKHYKEEPRITVCAWDTGSGSAGANFRRLFAQADLSRCDFVALSDQDDIWLPHKLISAVSSLNRTGGQGYSCSVRAFWPDGRERVLDQNASIRAADFLFEGAGQGCTFLLRLKLFLRVQRFCNEHHSESEALHYHDWLIYLLARAWDLPWYFDASPLLRYRQHGGNEIGARGSMSAINRRLNMLKDGWYRTQVRSAIRIYRLAGGKHKSALSLSALLESPPSLRRRIGLFFSVLMHGRRRLIDRGVLAASALIGWL